jgi:hypothetical protein
VGIEGEGASDAVRNWAMEDEVQGTELRKGIALDGALKEFGEMSGDALGGDFLFEQSEVVFAEGDEGDGDDVSFVAGAGVCELVEKHGQDSMIWTWGETDSRGISADVMAMTSRVEPDAPPPPAGPLV